jgi:hypothetical protein
MFHFPLQPEFKTFFIPTDIQQVMLETHIDICLHIVSILVVLLQQKYGICRQSLLTLPNITFHENIFSVSQAITSRGTEIEKLTETLPQFPVAM